MAKTKTQSSIDSLIIWLCTIAGACIGGPMLLQDGCTFNLPRNQTSYSAKKEDNSDSYAAAERRRIEAIWENAANYNQRQQTVQPAVQVQNTQRQQIVEAPQPVQPREPPNYRTTNFANDSDEVLLARTLFGEARNCSDNERAAIGQVILNRVQRGTYGNGIRGVVLRRNQFSCFNQNDPNRQRLMDPMAYEPQAFEDCLRIARGVLSGQYQDQTQGATNYFNSNSASPSWADSMTHIGRINGSRHDFYRE